MGKAYKKIPTLPRIFPIFNRGVFLQENVFNFKKLNNQAKKNRVIGLRCEVSLKTVNFRVILLIAFFVLTKLYH